MTLKTTKRLIIVGAGGFGREVLNWARDVGKQHKDWVVGGFLDVNRDALNEFSCDVGVVGDPATYGPGADDLLVCAIGDPQIKLRVCQDLESRGGEFITLIHPTAIVGTDSRIDRGSVLCPFSVVTTNAVLGKFVTLNLAVSIGHDVNIGDGCTLNSHSDVTGGANLDTGVFVGSHASILQNARVGAYSRIGAGSVVLRQVSPYTTVMGVPSKCVFRQPAA